MSETGSDGSAGSVDYLAVNEAGWDLLSLLDDPVAPDPERARSELDPFAWIRWDSVRTVLCLAGGGGWVAPRFACLGYQVTVVDISKGQLQRDSQIAAEEGLEIECVQADLLDLSPLADRRFDLIYQPVSACYVPDVARMYAEVRKVLAPEGMYVVKHWSPLQLQVSSDPAWDGRAYRVDRPAAASEAVLWQSSGTWTGERASCAHFTHSLESLVGGICDVGLRIVGFRQDSSADINAEPGSDAHLAAFFPDYIWMAAVQ